MQPENRRRNRSLVIAATLVVAAFGISICVGKYPIPLRDIATLLAGGEVPRLTQEVFWSLRVPRTVMALLAGIGLGMAGWVYQVIFKNPLASPDIIGVAGGANLGAAIAIVAMGNHPPWVTTSAFIGSMVVLMLVILLVRATGATHTTTYILAGIIMKALTEAGIMLLKYFADPEKELAAIEFWSMGSFGAITASKLQVVLPPFFLGLAGVLLLWRQVGLLGLEEEESRALGVRVGLVRIAVLGFSTLMVSSILSMTGLISFVGLIAPHIARLALRRRSFASCMMASLAGAFLLLMADSLARSLHGGELPISILTTLIGVPFMVQFMRKRRLQRYE